MGNQVPGENINVNLSQYPDETYLKYDKLQFTEKLLQESLTNRKIELNLILSDLQRSGNMQCVQEVIDDIKTLLGR